MSSFPVKQVKAQKWATWLSKFKKTEKLCPKTFEVLATTQPHYSFEISNLGSLFPTEDFPQVRYGERKISLKLFAFTTVLHILLPEEKKLLCLCFPLCCRVCILFCYTRDHFSQVVSVAICSDSLFLVVMTTLSWPWHSRRTFLRFYLSLLCWCRKKTSLTEQLKPFKHCIVEKTSYWIPAVITKLFTAGWLILCVCFSRLVQVGLAAPRCTAAVLEADSEDQADSLWLTIVRCP